MVLYQFFIGFCLAVSPAGFDNEFQRYCQEAANNETAIGVMDLKTGDLIAAANDTLLFRKRFPPGSVFKIVTALAALEAGVTTPVESLFCSGKLTLHNRKLDCSLRPGHGWVDVNRAIVYSCNNFFEEMGDRLDGELLLHQARGLKFDRRVGIDLPGEVEGIVGPLLTDSAKIDFAIGQGASIQVTPVALLALVSGIANHGRLLRPKLDKSLPTQTLAAIPDNRALTLVREAMRQCVKIGTATAASIPGLEIGGKTGTPVFINGWQTHGWFVGFAPFEHPEIAIVVLVLEGQGRTDAAPVAKKIIEKYFELKYGIN
jgi:cell division protein FtsI/penicillin-binding protein 2